MSTVFGRTSPAHPYDAALTALQTSKAKPTVAAAKNAIACNIRHDHRVSKEREQRFDDVCRQPRTGSELQKAISSYFDKRVRTQKLPDFVYYELNGNNLLCGHGKLVTQPAELRPAINKEIKLARILDLNNLRQAYSWLLDMSHRKPEWKEDFGRYYEKRHGMTNREEQSWIDCWLDKMLAPANPRRERFVESVLDMLECIRLQKAFQPTWATAWTAFEPHTKTPDGKANADRWVQVMGMGKNAPEHWYIALKYSVAEAGTLARPTQLDAGWYEYHFPPSEALPLEYGGHPMDLQVSTATSTLLPEYIHKQIEHPVRHWDDAERLLGRTSAWKASSLAHMRRMHEQLLLLRDGSSAQTNCRNRKGSVCVSI